MARSKVHTGVSCIRKLRLILTDPKTITEPPARANIANFEGATVVAPRCAPVFACSTPAALPRMVACFAFQKRRVGGIMTGVLNG